MPHHEHLFNAGYIANSLHPNISMQIFQTILYTLLMVLTRRIYWTIIGFNERNNIT